MPLPSPAPYSIEQRDDQILNTVANIVYDVSFERASQHIVNVKMWVSNVRYAELTVVMPSWTPGSYKIRDYAGYQGNIQVVAIKKGAPSPAIHRWRDKAALVIETNGAEAVEISYLVYGYERTVRTNHINRNHAFIVPAATFMYVEGRTDEIHHVMLHHDTAQWPQVSTQLSPVLREGQPRPGLLLGALNYDILVDSPIEVGNHRVVTFDRKGAKHELAVVSNQSVDIDWLARQVERIVDVEADMFGGVPYDRYVFILHVFPGASGGLEHARSSVNAVEPAAFLDRSRAKDLLALLCHEYFHLWNVKRIRPVELGPFDYTREQYTSMLWLVEGVTSYYDDLIAFRCGFLTEAEYLSVLSTEHVSRLMRVSGRNAMSVRDSSYLAWVKLYMQSPDGNNRFPSYYLKGGVVSMLLDMYIIDHTDGKFTLDHGLKALWQHYQGSPEKGLTENEVIAILERATGTQLRDRMMSWLNTTQELPYEDVLKPLGLRLDERVSRRDAITFGENRAFASVPSAVYTGWGLSDAGGRIVVRSIEDDSPAQKAGFGIDDEILAVNGLRITSTSHMDQILQSTGTGAVSITGQTDGLVFTTTMLPENAKNYVIESVDSPNERQRAMRTVWLKRTL